MRRLLLFLHMLDHRPSRFRASEQNVHVEIPTNGKIVVSDIPIFLVHKNQLLAPPPGVQVVTVG
jgi:hypothetical protein